MRHPARLCAAVLVATASIATALGGPLATPAAADDQNTAWYMRSEPGDYVGRGQTWYYQPSTAIISAEGDAREVVLSVDGINGRIWTARLAAPEGEELLAGSTYTAMRDPSGPDIAAMDVHGAGRGCNHSLGEFTVDQATYDDAGAVARFAFHFEQRCDDDDAALLGSVAVKSLEPAFALPPAPAEPVTDLTATAGLNGALVSWDNPGDDRFVTTQARLSKGPVAPATLDEGRRVYTGRGDQVLLHDLWLGQDFSVSVFTTGPDGSVAGPVSTRLLGTDLSFVMRQQPGRGMNLRIRLTDTTGEGVGDAHVALYERRPSSDRWRPVSGWWTHEEGRAVREWVTFRTRWYRAVYSGAGNHLGTVSSDLLVRGEPRRPSSR
jgi:hypothetical protein